MQIQDLDTPALLIDLDGLEDNLDRYQAYFTRIGVGLRPHIKTHKSLAMAHMQMQRGAIGITCQKLGEAEVMVNGGVDGDILIPYNIMGRLKLERLTALSRRTRLTVAADSAYTVEGLSAAVSSANTKVGVVVELDQGRTGVAPAQAAELGQLIDQSPGLELRGLMIMPSPPSLRPVLQEALDLFDRAGLPHPIVSGGCTPFAMEAHQIPELSEFRSGEYPTGGLKHLQGKTHTVAQCALRVLTTVVSRPGPDRAILDGGSKTFSAAMAQDEQGRPSMGHIIEYPQARFTGASEEHGNVDLSECDARPSIGETVQIIPVHPCPCVNEHDQMVAVRGDRVEALWPVDARGQIR
ncbi:MAG: D-TA family PLP-dependent enzyme [Candidatus Latescibacteria bacterium]|nr:D-TA family PLP-dependent enzyme [Candidatus Latescibacterota bacterium]